MKMSSFRRPRTAAYLPRIAILGEPFGRGDLQEKEGRTYVELKVEGKLLVGVVLVLSADFVGRLSFWQCKDYWEPLAMTAWPEDGSESVTTTSTSGRWTAPIEDCRAVCVRLDHVVASLAKVTLFACRDASEKPFQQFLRSVVTLGESRRVQE
jgi:hypothetical protein